MGRLSDYINGMSAGRMPAGAGASGGMSAGSGAAGGNDMLGVELNEAAAEAHLKALARMLTSDKDTRKRLQAVIRRELKAARNRTASDVHNALDNDPRKAYRAVKHSVYKQILGGNISILASRKAGAKYELLRQRIVDTDPKHHGGNRIKMSDRTYNLQTYYGKDRGFILRFINSGTDERHTRFGNRGSIAPRGMFERTAPWHLDQAAEIVASAFEEEFAAVYNEEMNNQ